MDESRAFGGAAMAAESDSPIRAARRRLEETVARSPQDARAHAELGYLLMLMAELDRAVFHARRAVELAPTDVLCALVLSSLLEAERQYPEAAEILEQPWNAGDRSTPLVLARVRLLQQVGREAEALDLILQMIEPAAVRPAREQASLHFAAANLLDQLGRYDQAFAHASRANSLTGIKYDRSLVERVANSALEYFDRKTLRRLPRAAARQPAPVFIVGMARSGTSLIEQILASHPAVYGGGETDRVYRLWESVVRRLSQPNLPMHHSLDRLTPEVANTLSAEFLAPLRDLAPSASHVTDKTPSNAVHLGLIATLFPNARLIHSRRDPLDTGISCYMTDFAAGNAFSHDLGSIGHYQRVTDRVMAHWQSVLDVPILQVDYEKLVVDPENQIRRLVQFVGLPWDERCLNFHQNRRIVATASQAQVRRPIYDTSIGRWRHYEKWIAPLRAALDLPG